MNAPFPLCRERVTVADLRDPGEVARIEGFVATMGGSVFHRPAWLLATAEGTGQTATGIIAEKGGQLTGWLSLTLVHSPIFGRALVSSGFAVGGGILAESSRAARKLAESATELAVRYSCDSVELRGGDCPEGWEPITGKHSGFAKQLEANDDAELAAVPRKHRAEIRKGLKADLDVSFGTDQAHRSAFYATYAASVHNLGTPVFPRSLFDAVLDRLGEGADIVVARHKGEPVSAVLNLYHRGTVMPFWGGGTFAARGLRANERVYYELMSHARARGCTRFDFGRSKTDSGPYNYKKNWGFEPEPLEYASWSAPGAPVRNIDPTDATYARKIDLWKRLPLPVANRLGPLIARGLA
ncbi:hypothetical protein HME9302_01275 [Alteripontixanthobacter maritimus]|uniref:BioF2-like acetyltransferase domain-containing protein n=1 Tax=Alteripontixanthobacter maritimus TaxID=2161824 RepID=A0A369QA44_9SPHN|nr:FemAB family XrtA/PEP-CTERM system-associated protein [Alteripontixanthobacter maritimus]RDC60076.1 hypothetical protein HME9302_01275 [Alteripontixanthobacter maritimus]